MQQVLKHIRWMPILMAATILGIAGFQYYWLKKAYVREERTLEMRSNFTFRETVHALQASKLRLDKVLVDSGSSRLIIKSGGDKTPVRVRVGPTSKMVGIVDVLNERLKDSLRNNRTIVFSERLPADTAGGDHRQNFRRRDKLMQFLYDAESPQDSVRVAEIDTLFRKRLGQANVSVPYSISRSPDRKEEEGFNKVTIGFKNPITYTLTLHHTFPVLIRRIMGPIVMSVFLVLFTFISFALLYRNLLKQRKLADIKNEFIPISPTS
jgi:two-component system phosphate regulon sensor histidine kinase PhoR